ncbi:MAG: glycoside hydrolase family 95 protein [Mariniphaga sp.]
MNLKKCFSVFFVALVLIGYSFAGDNSYLKLWYTQPAVKWSAEALPIGNGRMGAMFFGGIDQERIQFNEQSLWSGDNNWDGKYETGDHGFGCYHNFGELILDFSGKGQVKNYIRSLDIANGIHTTTFNQDGINFTREAFASYPDQVMVFNYTAGKKGAFSGKISFTSAQGATSTSTENSVSFSGEMPNKLKDAAIVRVLHDGGKTSVDGNSLVFEGCNSLILLVDARANYKPDYDSGWRGADPMPMIEKELASAQAKTYKFLRADHIRDLSGLLGRVSMNIGSTSADLLALPTDERLKRYSGVGGPVVAPQGDKVDATAFDNVKREQKATEDPDLEETMFQYGRYLLASSSRPGGLPANLQGLWNDSR